MLPVASLRPRTLVSSVTALVLTLALLGTHWSGAVPIPVATASVSSPTILTYTGAPQQYTVPANIDTLVVQLVGGSGGGGLNNGMYQVNAQGGSGGQVIVQLSVTPGESLQFNIGGAGENGPQTLEGDPSKNQVTFHIAKGGWNGGGDAGFSTYTYQGDVSSSFVGNFAGGGGGATDIRACFSAQNTICPASQRIAVAGGGGGAGMDNGANTTSAAGGAGGIFANGSGAAGNANPLTSVPTDGVNSFPPGTINATPGLGATQAAGGAGGSPTNLAPSGYEGGKFCSGGTAGQGGVAGAGQPGTSGVGGKGGSGEVVEGGFNSTTFGGGGGGGGYFGGGGGGCGGFAWKNMQYGIQSVYFPGTAGGGGGSSWVDPTRAVAGTLQYGAASLTHAHGYAVIQGLRLGSTGAPQAIAIPANADAVDYTLNGAQGGDYGLGTEGGAGASFTGSLIPFTAGDVMQINVGGGGQVTDCGGVGCPPTAFGGPPVFNVTTDSYTSGTFALQSGWNGGGFAVPLSNYTSAQYWGYSYPQAGGGGASDLRICPGGTSLTAARTALCSGPLAPFVIAAGGGGASVVDFWEAAVNGGWGGCTDGQEPSDSTDGGAGRGGTQSAGGIGGGAGTSGSSAGSPGAAGVGGNGGLGDTQIDQDRQGSGGGGGYFGGGGGGGGGSVGDALFHSAGAGGGGSSLSPANATCTDGGGPESNATFSSAGGNAELSFPVLVPGQPFNINATKVSSATEASVAWTENGAFGAAITSAQIAFSTDNGSTWSTPQTITPATSPATVTGLAASTDYVFRVALVNSFGASPWSKNSNRVLTPAAVPAQVTGLTVSAAPNGVAATWSAPADNGSSITSYTVEYSNNGGSSWSNQSVTAPTTSVAIGNLTSADSYIVRVAAVNSVGTGTVSANSSSVVPIGIPSAPGTPTATPAYREIALSWSAASVAGSPGNGQAITGYQVEATDTVTGDVAVIDTGSTSTSYTVKGIFSGHPLTFRVRGLNVDVPGAWSSASAAVSADSTATAPLSVQPTRAVEAVNLSWTQPANLGGGTIDGYRIERITPGLNARWTTALVTTGSTTSATINNLTPGVGYRFRVAAVTDVPIGGGASADVVGPWSFPTFSLSPLPRSQPGPLPSPTPTPTPTPSSSPSAPPTASPTSTPTITPLPAPGQASALIGGNPANIQVRDVPRRNPIGSTIQVAGVRGGLIATDQLGRPQRLTKQGSLVLESPRQSRTKATVHRPSGQIQIRLEGIERQSNLSVAVVTPSGSTTPLRSQRADARGEIDALLAIPSGLPSGAAGLRLVGVNNRGQGFDITLGVRVKTIPAQAGVQRAFDLDSQASLTSRNRRDIARLASTFQRPQRQAVITLVVSSQHADTRRFERQKRWFTDISTTLRGSGFTGSIRHSVTVVPPGLPNSVTVTIR